ncbi:hypothetical protein [Luteimonas vadosa]|uniref:Uncharacterized protein n=1 Tax=Luteimonas vadosa TaxID=1165507 RepID=A0ABP9ED88_9GAMM
MKKLSILRCLAALLVALPGCKSMQAVTHDAWSNVTANVEAGDTVEVVTTDGQIERFVVTQVTADALVGNEIHIAKEDITRLQVRAVHKGRTFGAAFGGAAAALVIVLAAATAAFLGGG